MWCCYLIVFQFKQNGQPIDSNPPCRVIFRRSPFAIHWDQILACLIMSIALTFNGGCPSFWNPSNIAKSTQNSWSIGNHLVCWHAYTFLCILFNTQLIIYVEHMGHPWYPFVTRPTTIPYDGRSWIVHINIASILNFVWLLNVATSHTCTPIFHSSFNPSINSSK
jgi:hypothetical protein